MSAQDLRSTRRSQFKIHNSQFALPRSSSRIVPRLALSSFRILVSSTSDPRRDLSCASRSSSCSNQAVPGSPRQSQTIPDSPGPSETIPDGLGLSGMVWDGLI